MSDAANMNPKLLEARNAVLVYLASQAHMNSYSHIAGICNELNIAEEMTLWLTNHLYRNGFVSGPKIGQSPEMMIKQKGLEEVDRIENEYFASKRRPMILRNSYETTIDESCEYLFQMHIKNKFRLEWTKSIYNNAPDKIDAAKDLMLAQNILKEGRDWQETKLNPELYEVDNYKEAKIFLQNKSNVPGGSTHNYHVQQAGAVGPYSIAHDNTFNQVNYQLPPNTDFGELRGKLEELRKALAGEADQPEHYAALGEIKKAEIAATEKNGSKVVESLKAAGKWILEKGADIGKEVAVTYIKSLIGNGPHP